jgi:hypothetical protein
VCNLGVALVLLSAGKLIVPAAGENGELLFADLESGEADGVYYNIGQMARVRP